MTEIGATNNLQNITEVIQQADLRHTGWLEWAFTGNAPTSTAVNAQALVYNPELPPTGDNVNTAKLPALAEPYPQVVAGTPKLWAFRRGKFQLPYATERADHHGGFVSGEQTIISVPPVEYPNGYQVSVKGGQVTSAPGAALLTIVADPGRKHRQSRGRALTASGCQVQVANRRRGSTTRPHRRRHRLGTPRAPRPTRFPAPNPARQQECRPPAPLTSAAASPPP